ncbi:MAG: hypothetical protein ABIZ91_01865 [Gemmatimonadaceae bacterium]
MNQIARCLGILLLLAPSVVQAQRLRDRLSQLFVFGPGQDPLFLAGSATSSNPASLQAHGRHFVPSANAENGSVINFITRSLASRVAAVPIGATTSGETFSFEGGIPVATSTSAGPIFAERSQTLGKGRVFAGIARSSFGFTSLRGMPLSALRLTFTHENVDFPGCSEQQGNDCKKYGVPLLENESMDFDLNLDIHVNVTSFVLTYGIGNRVDAGIVIPLLNTSFNGTSSAQIIPFGSTSAAHFFAGTTDYPVLNATRSTSGSAFGIGDVAARVKVNVHQTATTGIAFLLDQRFPTGDKNDLLGAGKGSTRFLAVLSSSFGQFSPHVNAGYSHTADREQNDYVLAIAGFDQVLGKRVTLAADVVSEFQVGSSRLLLPKPVTLESPYRRELHPTSIPDIRDDIINGSFGLKFRPASRTTLVTNALFPLNEGGLRSRITYTLGFEYAY